MTIEDFRVLYEQHVGHVAGGNMKAALADMVRENIPQVFEGVDTPREAPKGFEIKNVRADGDRMVGETVYDMGDHSIGLRSIWELHDGRWLAARLENFSAGTEAGA